MVYDLGELRSRIDVPTLPKLLTVAFCRISWQTLTPEALALVSSSVRKLNFNPGHENSWSELQEKLRCLFSQTLTSASEIDQLRLQLCPSLPGKPLLQTRCSRIHHLEIEPQLGLDELRLLTEFPALQHLSIRLSRMNSPTGENPFLAMEFIATLAVEGAWMDLCTLFNAARLSSMHTVSIAGWGDYGPAVGFAEAATQCLRTLSTK